jgi:isoleucyl-tRNA synthetase
MQEQDKQQKSERALREEAILAFWKERDIFKKSLTKDASNGEFVFYEGPPTANAKPALHHLEARAFKDVIPRYKTMQGYHVRRKAGWDTHGLPVELQIEKKLGFQSKKDIEGYGIAKFNKECKESVHTYIDEWKTFTERMGYWVDFNDAYYTYDPSYMESLWNIVGKVHEQGLLYKDYKVVPWCPRCGTALASHELAQGYQDVKDLSVYAKFKVTSEKIGNYEVGNNTYIIAWTTTPWTLPGNVALAVGEEINYTLVAAEGNEVLIVASDRISELPVQGSPGKTIKGSELVGIEYEPLYPFLKDALEKKGEDTSRAFKVYPAGFVTTTDGTGIVHTAVMYGQDDFELGTKVGLPKVHTVSDNGHFLDGMDFLSGRFVKDEEVAIDIIKDLAHRGLLFKKEKYEHSYPHCWRCKTPLIYYARDSWYIGMSKLRDRLIKENEKINWEPAHIKEGRFGEWLRDVKDWAISRERYWGTPLPVWINEEGERIVVDSIDTIKKYSKRSGNRYFAMRHGEAQHNLTSVWSVIAGTNDLLTEKGKEQVLKSASALKEKIDYIIASPFNRGQETARIAAEALGIAPEQIIIDPRISEWNVGSEFDGQDMDGYFMLRNTATDRYRFKTGDGESYADVFTRTGAFLYDLESQYKGKNILIVTHGGSARALELVARGFAYDTLFATTREYRNFDNAEVREISFVPLPHNDLFELDLHRPYIDEVVLEKDGVEYRRVKEVMDVWFDSGSMPFAQDHWPFAFPKHGLFGTRDKLSYPADFISEAIDQTRGWFYTMLAVGVLMDRGAPYKNVICLGHLLDKDGKKMSKSIGNVIEPFEQIEKFGVDTVRLWMYSVNAPGEGKNYDEKTVGELQRQVFGLLYNVLAFYELYRDTSLEDRTLSSDSVLDAWITARLDQLVALTTEELDNYRLMNPVREIRAFIEDLSTWYVRRSRDRIKDGDADAKATLYRVLKVLAQILAPFAPFASEDIWQQLRHDTDAESVHLSNWPKSIKVNDEVLEHMKTTRDICTEGNALRKKAGIAVKQPLGTLHVANLSLKDAYIELIKDELNVKTVTSGAETVLDTTITPELKLEGSYRELVRSVQELRKEKGLMPQDTIMLTVPESYQEIVNAFGEELKKAVGAGDVAIEGTEITIK